MAIQVGGTTVIDNSRNLSNVGGLKTVGGTSILGSGNITTGGSTTAGDVGTYALLYEDVYNTVDRNFGDTLSASTLLRGGLSRYSPYVWGNKANSVSGTWRLMGDYPLHSYQRNNSTNIWVRIS